MGGGRRGCRCSPPASLSHLALRVPSGKRGIRQFCLAGPLPKRAGPIRLHPRRSSLPRLDQSPESLPRVNLLQPVPTTVKSWRVDFTISYFTAVCPAYMKIPLDSKLLKLLRVWAAWRKTKMQCQFTTAGYGPPIKGDRGIRELPRMRVEEDIEAMRSPDLPLRVGMGLMDGSGKGRGEVAENPSYIQSGGYA